MKGSYSGYHFYHTNPNCGRKDYFAKLCRLSLITPARPLLMGTILHTAQAAYYSSGLDESILQRTYEEEMRNHESQLESYQSDFAEGAAMLKAWLAKWHDLDLAEWRILAVEKELECKLIYKSTPYVGTIRPDLIVEEKAPPHAQIIVDHKHTWSSIDRTYATCDNEDQASIYIWGARQHGFRPEGFLPDILYKRQSVVRAERYAPLYRSDGDILRALKALASKISTLNRRMEEAAQPDADLDYIFPREPSYSCAFSCEYQPICRNGITPSDVPYGFRKELSE